MRAVPTWLGGIVLITGGLASPLNGSAQTRSVRDSSEAESLATVAKDRQSATANAKDGFSLRSADGHYTLRIRGYAQADGRFFPSDDADAVSDDFLLRRARPILEVTVGKYFGFRVMPEFAGSRASLQEAYWEGKFDPALSVRAGKFKPPIGFERLQSAADLGFAERGLPTNLVPSRDIGLQVAGEAAGVFEYQAGIFNGAPDLGSPDNDLNDAKDLVARVFFQPFQNGALRGLGLGISGSTGIEEGTPTATDLAGYRSGSQQTFFRYRTDAVVPDNTVVADGRRSRLAPHAYLGLGAFGLLGEYTVNRQEVRRGVTTARLTHRAWQASGSFFLTGEYAGFRSPSPKKPFDPSAGTFGAVELAARYGELELDEDAFPVFADPASSAAKARALGLGVNWHLNKQIKLLMSYEHTRFEGGDRASEDLVVARFQHSF